MLHHRGLWWYYKCGHFCSLGRAGRSAPKKLLEPCIGRERRTRAGQGHLNRLARGLHPKPGSDWPDPHGTRVDLHDVLPAVRLRDKTSFVGAAECSFEAQPANAPVIPPPDEDVAGDAIDCDDELVLALPCGLDTDSDMDELA